MSDTFHVNPHSIPPAARNHHLIVDMQENKIMSDDDKQRQPAEQWAEFTDENVLAGTLPVCDDRSFKSLTVTCCRTPTWNAKFGQLPAWCELLVPKCKDRDRAGRRIAEVILHQSVCSLTHIQV